jgi:hypothetical protein
MKKDADYFDNHDPQLIYIAKRLRDATALESILTASDIDYSVEPDEYQGGVIFKTNRIGAFFYVRPEAREKAISVMRQNHFVPAK